jgi:hypothetical protein
MFQHINIDNQVVSILNNGIIRISPQSFFENQGIDCNIFPKLTLGSRLVDNQVLCAINNGSLEFSDLFEQEKLERRSYVTQSVTPPVIYNLIMPREDYVERELELF